MSEFPEDASTTGKDTRAYNIVKDQKGITARRPGMAWSHSPLPSENLSGDRNADAP